MYSLFVLCYNLIIMINITKIRQKIVKAGFQNITVSLQNGGVLLEGELDVYEDIVFVGKLAVDKKSRGVINNIKLSGHTPKPMRVPHFSDNMYEGRTPDVVIVGGGIVGCAIARELSRYKLDIMLLEKEYDVAVAQSSRNDGMIHAGIDLKHSSIKVKYNMRGNKLYDTISKELDVPISKCGQCVIFNKSWHKIIYPIIKIRASFNKIPVKYLNKKEVNKIIPNPGIKNDGFMCGGAGIMSPYLMTVAFAENAVTNGVQICLNTAVLDIENDGKKVLSVTTNRGIIKPKVLINAAGVFSDVIAEKAGDRFFTINPRKGVEGVIDNKLANLANSVIGTFELKSAIKSAPGAAHTKGGGVVKTIDNNFLIGPSAFPVIDREDDSTTREAMEQVYQKQSKLAPDIKRSDIITYFAGIRAATYEETFIVQKSPIISNFVQAAGIQSPGLTAAPAIAQDIAKFTLDILSENGTVSLNEQFSPHRKGIPCVKDLDEKSRNELIKRNPDYGIIICRCEQVSKGEIIDAITSPLPVYTIDSIKRRVRAGMGRCQGGFCSPLITKIIAKQTGMDISEITKKGQGSELIIAKTKEQK